MIKKLRYMDIEYTDSDLEYIDYISEIIDAECERIIDFFELDKYEGKTHVKLFNSLEEFRNCYREIHNKEPRNWVCGFAIDKDVYTLMLNEYRKTKSHENDNLNALIKLILHEFTHAVHMRRHSNIIIKWISEGAATYLSGQYENSNEINCNYEQLLEHTSYPNYRAMFAYVLENYGKDYILKLMDDEELLVNETEKLFNEACNMNHKRIK